MLSKKDIQFIRSLAIKKYRQKYNKYIAEGEKICLEIIRQCPEQINRLYALSEFATEYSADISEKQIPLSQITTAELKRCSQLKSPNKVLAICHISDPAADFNDWEDEVILYLDDIRDPGNMGTLLRSAEWFGLKHVLLSPNCVDVYNAKCVQASMGSIFRVNALNTGLDEFLKKSSRDYHIYLAEMKGSDAFQEVYQKPLVLVLGSESHGVQMDIDRKSVNSVRIPRRGEMTESLNVGVAGSILLAEISK